MARGNAIHLAEMGDQYGAQTWAAIASTFPEDAPHDVITSDDQPIMVIDDLSGIQREIMTTGTVCVDSTLLNVLKDLAARFLNEVPNREARVNLRDTFEGRFPGVNLVVQENPTMDYVYHVTLRAQP